MVSGDLIIPWFATLVTVCLLGIWVVSQLKKKLGDTMYFWFWSITVVILDIVAMFFFTWLYSNPGGM